MEIAGTYFISGEKSRLAPERPTYKLDGKDRYIFYWPDDQGWRVGRLNWLRTGERWYRSKRCLIIF